MALDGELEALCEGLLQIGERNKRLRKNPRSFELSEEPPPGAPDKQGRLFPQVLIVPDLRSQETPRGQLALFPDILKAQAGYEVRALCALLSAQPSIGNGKTRHEH